MPDPVLPDTHRKLDKKDPNPCAGCSNCCEYMSLEIDKPTTVTEADQILWYLLHKDVWVYVEGNYDWYVQFNTPCEKLHNYRCQVYENRPMICRKYEPVSCLRYGGDSTEKYLFKNDVDYLRYLAARKPKLFKGLSEKIGITLESIGK
ncbi:MAG: YkgJ family cysteine cluster protein [Candidatus Omnitrophota bacterium]|nr:YkgJ family cysteine cluster protein [Candidatus Omnitrophota bacterium]